MEDMGRVLDLWMDSIRPMMPQHILGNANGWWVRGIPWRSAGDSDGDLWVVPVIRKYWMSQV
jgi:hypothetical protein